MNFLDRIKQAFAPLADEDVANKKYVDDLAAAIGARIDEIIAAGGGGTGDPGGGTGDPGTGGGTGTGSGLPLEIPENTTNTFTFDVDPTKDVFLVPTSLLGGLSLEVPEAVALNVGDSITTPGTYSFIYQGAFGIRAYRFSCYMSSGTAQGFYSYKVDGAAQTPETAFTFNDSGRSLGMGYCYESADCVVTIKVTSLSGSILTRLDQTMMS